MKRITSLLVGVVVSAAMLLIAPVADAVPDPDRVRYYQQKLYELGYWLPDVNGQLDNNTRHAVTAFQKIAGVARTGELDSPTKKAIAKKFRPTARSTGEGRIAEVDVAHQVLLLVKNGKVRWILDVSTGKPSTPTKHGYNRFYREYDGMRASGMYRPKYFWRSAAIHGYASVPNYPASRGCVRVTNATMDWLWKKDALPLGMTIWVY